MRFMPRLTYHTGSTGTSSCSADSLSGGQRQWLADPGSLGCKGPSAANDALARGASVSCVNPKFRGGGAQVLPRVPCACCSTFHGQGWNLDFTPSLEREIRPTGSTYTTALHYSILIESSLLTQGFPRLGSKGESQGRLTVPLGSYAGWRHCAHVQSREWEREVRCSSLPPTTSSQM